MRRAFYDCPLQVRWLTRARAHDDDARVARLPQPSDNNSTHLTPDPANRYIVIGNGVGVAVFPINPDSSLAPYTDMVRAGGDVGPHRNQVRLGPHPRYVDRDRSIAG